MADLLPMIDATRAHGSGSITLIVGPMFSGKTTELIRRLRVALVAGRSCCIVRPLLDNRWEASELNRTIHTHHTSHSQKGGLDDKEIPIYIQTSLLDSSKSEHTPLNSFDVIAIDEGQFFGDLAEGCTELARKGAHIIVSALNGTFGQTGFPPVTALYPHCDKLIMLRAVCMSCRTREASFTTRISAQSSETSEGGFIDVGGEDKYRAVCRRCLEMARLAAE
jgi:thymidine kinase